MKPFDPFDHEAAEEIAARKTEMHSKINLANEKSNSNQPDEDSPESSTKLV